MEGILGAIVSKAYLPVIIDNRLSIESEKIHTDIPVYNIKNSLIIFIYTNTKKSRSEMM